jgi:hypothetical protein
VPKPQRDPIFLSWHPPLDSELFGLFQGHAAELPPADTDVTGPLSQFASTPEAAKAIFHGHARLVCLGAHINNLNNDATPRNGATAANHTDLNRDLNGDLNNNSNSPPDDGDDNDVNAAPSDPATTLADRFITLYNVLTGDSLAEAVALTHTKAVPPIDPSYGAFLYRPPRQRTRPLVDPAQYLRLCVAALLRQRPGPIDAGDELDNLPRSNDGNPHDEKSPEGEETDDEGTVLLVVGC